MFTENRICRLAEIMEISGLSASSVYRQERAGLFPRRVKIGHTAVGWRYADIVVWLNARQPAGAIGPLATQEKPNE